MNTQQLASYLLEQTRRHASIFFSEDACSALKLATIEFLPWQQCLEERGQAIVIPTDIPLEVYPKKLIRNFNGEELSLWGQLTPPDRPGWTAVPQAFPLWYKSKTGTLIPSWNVFRVLLHLLMFEEEVGSKPRDSMGRFLGKQSPREPAGLLETPIFNQWVALLIGAALAMKNGSDAMENLKGHVFPPVIILSHDVDSLRGNDFWTQGIRFYRTFLPLLKSNKPRLSNLRWIRENYRNPTEYYLNDIGRLIEAERKFGFKSSFYFLNGTGGRFGARSGSGLLKQAIEMIEPGWQCGMHYNFDTHLSSKKFVEQKKELELIKAPVLSGRAHYLRFDSVRSPEFFNSNGIKVDESAGFPDRVGYRCGIAGGFQPIDRESGQALPLVEIPLTFMESTLLNQYEQNSFTVFNAHFQRARHFGGAVTLLFHPGLFANPEFPQFQGLYTELLKIASGHSARSMTALQYAELFSQP